MHQAFVARWRAGVTAVMLVLFAFAGPVAAGQSVATPEGGCVQPAGSPIAGQATPAASGAATPEASPAGSADGGDSVVDTESLVKALEACGADVQETRGVEQPFLKPESGTGLRITGAGISQPADLQVFEYGDAAQASADAAQIGPDGNPKTMMILWIEPPHFFQAERIIVLYIGTDQAVIDLLTTVLGPPFAGG